MARLGTLFALALAGTAHAQVGMPEGFFTTTTGGFAAPTSFAAAPDGRVFIGEKLGRIVVFNPASPLPPRLVVDLTPHVNSYGDRGLLGLAVDKDFATNGYLYAYYVYEHKRQDPDGPKVARLTRITVNPDGTVANPIAPETVILGSYAPPPQLSASCPAADNRVDCIPAETNSHNGGAIRIAADGSIFLAVGDGNLAFAEPNRFRPYDERSLSGKIVHIDRNGHGLPGHPFCAGDLDLTKVCSKLWAKGFRNPFRMTLRPDGLPLVGDVGHAKWEEVDLVRPGGNYGWPCYEASARFQSLAGTPRCQQEYALEGTANASRPPMWEYAHEAAVGAAVIQGPQYNAALFPGRYRGSVFVGDYIKGTIERLTLDSSDRVVGVERFASQWRGVDLQEMPDGRLGYILLSGTFGTIGYGAANRVPVAAAAADRNHGSLPLAVRFDASASTDQDGDPLSYEWSFGDGTPTATGAVVDHTFTTAGKFTVTVTARDGRGGQDTDSLTVWAGDRAPVPVISTPGDGSLYRNGVPVTLQGSASDPEDGTVPASALHWKVVLHHAAHQHPFQEFTGAGGEFTPLVDHDADSYYEITLTATDSLGLSASRTISVRPQTVRLTLASQPPGALLSYAGNDWLAPVTLETAVGFRAAVSAPTTVSRDGITYVFDRWSDGGAQAHTIFVGESDSTLTAIFRQDSDPPQTTITERPLQHTPTKANTFAFESDEPNSRFQCRHDSGSWFACTSPYKSPPMSQGWHAFLVRAIDAAGNVDPTPAQWTYNVKI